MPQEKVWERLRRRLVIIKRAGFATTQVVAYIFGGFCMLSLEASTLDAPTLVVQEYNESFLAKSPRNAVVLSESGIRGYLKEHMVDAEPAKVARLSRLIAKLSKQHGLPAGLILSVIRVESNFRAWAVSPVGALGLMQVMPETGEWLAARYGMEWNGPASLLDEETNTVFGVRYLAYLKDKYNGDLKKMLAAYNCGPAKVDEDVAGGRRVAMEYYHRIRKFLPKFSKI